MFILKNLEAETLTTKTLNVKSLAVGTISNITKDEFSQLSGLTFNLQEQLNTLNTNANNLVTGW